MRIWKMFSVLVVSLTLLNSFCYSKDVKINIKQIEHVFPEGIFRRAFEKNELPKLSPKTTDEKLIELFNLILAMNSKDRVGLFSTLLERGSFYPFYFILDYSPPNKSPERAKLFSDFFKALEKKSFTANEDAILVAIIESVFNKSQKLDPSIKKKMIDRIDARK